MADPENANPTILSQADLPTRAKATKTPALSTFRQAILSPTHLPTDPFSLPETPVSPSSSSSSTNTHPHASDSSEEEEEIDPLEIYSLISSISDPEHPLTLGQLSVANLPDISITPTLPHRPSSRLRTVTVLLTPTITHCSLATVIGLGVRARLEEALPKRFRVDVRIKEGTHSTGEEVGKQLGDKERVCAALENGSLRGVVGRMLETCE